MSGRNGYIKLHRKMLDWGWYQNQNVKDLFIHLLLIANFKESQFEDMTIYPGQIITSIDSLSRATGMAKQSIRTSLKKLEKSKIITKQSTSRFTLVTVENWELYQCEDLEVTKSLTNEQQTDNKRVTNVQQHHKNANNAKNAKNSVCVIDNKAIYNKDDQKIGQRPHTHPYGEFENVYLKEHEYEQLCQRYMQTKQLIEKVSEWLTEHERKNHYALCLKFAKNDEWPKKSNSSSKWDKAFEENKKKAAPMPEHMRKKYKI
ncbi:hypothetical protein HMPREF1635_02050 [Clostridiales bacterium S5-A14a]|nr:hypothetical protein HMPREF1635_02050 [Clostridiales bacterium S5-A14a]